MNNKKIFCFTHSDLDGAVAFLATKWAHPGYVVNVKPIKSVAGAREDVTQWLLKNNFSDYQKVFFLDLDVSDVVDLIDHDNVMIIDHHKSHVDNKKYKNAAPIIKEYPSASLLAYKIFKKIYNTEYTTAQKTLILYANDYDSYTHDLPESKILNTVFWNTQNSFDSFVKNYSKGFKPFSKQQQAIYKIYKNEIDSILKNIKIFQGVYTTKENDAFAVLSTFAEKHINDVADHLIENYTSDIVMIINLKSGHVSFRRPKEGQAKLNTIAEELADGGGHEYAAGGTLTTKFLEFTKSLKPL